MRRREFLAQFSSAAAAWTLVSGSVPVHAQTPNRVYRLGNLGNAPSSEEATRQITLPELAKLGYVEGRNLIFDPRVGKLDALPSLMRELLAARPDAVIAIGGPAIATARAATSTVPIVTLGGSPIELGLAASYARPAGNVTGVVILVSELEVKRLSILHETVPDRRRVAVLTSATTTIGEAAMRKAAAELGVELLAFSATAPGDYPAAFAAMSAAGAQALVISASSEFYQHAKQLAALALEARLPTVCEWADMAHAGCLIGYGPNRAALRKRMAAQIALILGGEAPGNIPIERPTVFEFAVNQNIARSLGLSIPSAVLVQADDVID